MPERLHLPFRSYLRGEAKRSMELLSVYMLQRTNHVIMHGYVLEAGSTGVSWTNTGPTSQHTKRQGSILHSEECRKENQAE